MMLLTGQRIRNNGKENPWNPYVVNWGLVQLFTAFGVIELRSFFKDWFEKKIRLWGLSESKSKIRVGGGSMFPSTDFNQKLCCVGLDSQILFFRETLFRLRMLPRPPFSFMKLFALLAICCWVLLVFCFGSAFVSWFFFSFFLFWCCSSVMVLQVWRLCCFVWLGLIWGSFWFVVVGLPFKSLVC